MAATFNVSGSVCRKLRIPFFTARKSNPATIGVVALIKVPVGTNNIPEDGEKDSRTVLIVCLSVTSVLVLFFAAFALYYHPITKRFKSRKPPSVPYASDFNLRAFTFQELYEATDGFSNRIGKGSFGTVYSGTLGFEDKEIDIAVKQLDNVIERGEKEFLTEVKLNRIEEETEEDDLVLTDWVLKCVRMGRLNLVVNNEPEVLEDFRRFERLAMVGLWCVHPDPILRPTMKKVTQMLEGTAEVGVPPLAHDLSLS
ncbi:hypothetical protein P3X46_034430 [Hevea brasiliensis]|uniref:Serine-threonine/tyrosine-protein kinase catalytic domain-containing protein n=1 Tax=Hevea brasiliensis TaxID=3981 RepID=A0ABQ9K9J5_HEVBR|nr:hypothetical protein P3X46_034430 [Hevea brasiliensis]